MSLDCMGLYRSVGCCSPFVSTVISFCARLPVPLLCEPGVEYPERGPASESYPVAPS